MAADIRTPLESDGRRVRGDLKRAAILSEAIQIASSEGLEGLTLGRVAAAAGVPKSSLQVLFKDRETLQISTLEAGALRFEQELMKKLPASTEPLKYLRALTKAWFELVELRHGGCLVTASTSEFRVRPGVLRELVLVHRKRWRSVLLKAIRAAKSAGTILPNVDPEDLVFQIIAFQAAANAAILDDGAQDFRRARRSVKQLLESVSRSGATDST
jgi:AcrR family transcriptional regulator